MKIGSGRRFQTSGTASKARKPHQPGGEPGVRSAEPDSEVFSLKTAIMDNVKDAPVKARESSSALLSKPALWWDRARTFTSEVRAEMRRVTWPSRREVYATTVVVILTSIVFGLYLWGLDLVLTAAVNWVYRVTGTA
jgi:preprotein translocase subunit SecE